MVSVTRLSLGLPMSSLARRSQKKKGEFYSEDYVVERIDELDRLLYGVWQPLIDLVFTDWGDE